MTQNGPFVTNFRPGYSRTDDGARRERGVTVLIIDDNADMRYLVRVLTEIEGADKVVGEACTATDGLAMWRERRPDVVVLDYRMDDANGIDVATWMLHEDPDQEIILFSAFLTDENMAAAELLGVACVSKDDVRRLPALIHEAGLRVRRSA